MTAFAKIEPSLAGFIAALDTMSAKYYSQNLPETYATGRVPTYTLERGKKYIRVVAERNLGSARVYCFLDADGNIYKSESWKKPARGARGSLFDPNYSIGKGLTLYGGAYSR